MEVSWRVAYLRTFNYASVRENGGKFVRKSFVQAAIYASAYIPVVGTISHVALLAIGLPVAAIKKDLELSLVGMFGLRTALTLAPPLLFAIDMVTTIAQARINKKEPKMLARVHY